MSDFNVSLQESGGEFAVKFRADPGLPASVTPLTVSENGDYDAGEDAAYNPVHVRVPMPVIEPLVTAQNGTYTAQGGFNPVSVNVRQGIPINITNHINSQTGEWERPADWPDLDALAEQITGEQDCVYLTYDLQKTPGYGWIGYYAETADRSAWTMERGHVASGAFVIDETFSTASGGYFRQALDATNGNVQLWRIRATGHITDCGFAPNSTVSAENYPNNMQPCVERAGALPWCTNWGNTNGVNAGNRCGATIWLERDSFSPGAKAIVTDMYNRWSGSYSLQSLDLSGWNTTNWAVANLAICWQNCYSLQSLDLSGWDTTNWAVTTLASCWQNCYSLIRLTGTKSWTWAESLSSNTSNPNNSTLRDFEGIPLSVNHSYNQALWITPKSLVKILQTLPTVSAARTITLGQTNKLKLTSEQIAIATQKGWTVA